MNLTKKFFLELDKNKVPSNATIILHSAFKPFGALGLDALEFCQKLQEYFYNGTILMPTMTWRTVTKAKPNFYTHSTPSHTGVLSEVFRKSVATHRSVHPTHSVAAWGKHAHLLTKSHHNSCSPCSLTSPYGVINSTDLVSKFYILLLNVGLESCTFIHHFEEMHAPDIYLNPEVDSFYLHTGSEEPLHYLLRSHKKITRDFHQFGHELFLKKVLAKITFEDIDVFLIDGQKLSQILERNFHSSPLATLARKSYFSN